MYPSTPGEDKEPTPKARKWARENYRKSGLISTGKEKVSGIGKGQPIQTGTSPMTITQN